MYYVYIHKLRNGEIFYVGMGQNRRAYAYKNRTFLWKMKAKDGYSIEFISTNLTKGHASELEMKLIQLYFNSIVNIQKGSSYKYNQSKRYAWNYLYTRGNVEHYLGDNGKLFFRRIN